MSATSTDTDEFWSIALQKGNEVPWSDSEDEDEGCQRATYRILAPSLRLKLASKPLSGSMNNPVGSEAWFGSAILAALLLGEESSDGSSSRWIRSDDHSFLELGSGAVGFSGLCLALTLSKRDDNSNVILSDNQPDLLDILRANVVDFHAQVREQQPDLELPRIQVENFDWTKDEDSERIPPVDLVVGAELVYTGETANACAHCLNGLRRSSPALRVLIVQVSDRYGFRNIFLPALEGAQVHEEPVPANIHERACSWIPHGGTLDRFDFTICSIQW